MLRLLAKALKLLDHIESAIMQDRLAFSPAAGGVPFPDASGDCAGAIGISGDTADNDEACARHAIEAAGLVAWLDGP
jgi:uncharacterized protein GlcG (DUF336 family)